MLLAACYVAGIGVMYAALGVGFALAGRAFGTFMANPWVMVPIARALRGHGGVDVRRLRADAAAGAADAAVVGRRQGLRRRLRHGPGRRHHRRALHRSGAGVGARLRGDDPLGGPRRLAPVHLRARHGRALLRHRRLRRRAAQVGRVDGGGQERLRRGHDRRGALLPAQRRAGRSRTTAAPTPPLARRQRRRSSLAGARARRASTCRSTTGAAATLRKALGVGSWSSPAASACIAWALAPKPAAAGARTGCKAGDRRLARARAQAGAARLLRRLVPALQRAGAQDLRASAEVAAELQRFTLVKVDCTNDDDPVVAEAKKRYGADTLPTLVLLDSDGKVAQKIDHFVEPDELLPLLRDAESRVDLHAIRHHRPRRRLAHRRGRSRVLRRARRRHPAPPPSTSTACATRARRRLRRQAADRARQPAPPAAAVADGHRRRQAGAGRRRAALRLDAHRRGPRHRPRHARRDHRLHARLPRRRPRGGLAAAVSRRR